LVFATSFTQVVLNHRAEFKMMVTK